MAERKDIFDNYAIFQTGGKQYQAIPGRTIAIEKIDGEAGKNLEFSDVLLRRHADGTIEVGTPFLAQPIKASIVKQMREPKVIIFKFKRRKKSRVKNGHRQPKTVIRVDGPAIADDLA